MIHPQLIFPIDPNRANLRRIKVVRKLKYDYRRGRTDLFTDRDVAVLAPGEPLRRKGPSMEHVLWSAQDYSDSARNRLMADVQPDEDLTRIFVGRVIQYVQTHYT